LLDVYTGKSLLIAATNLEGVLDSAVWRRFDEVMFFEPPNLEQLRRLLTCKLRGLRREFKIESNEVVNLFKGMSHADVERVLRNAAKEMVLLGQEFLSERHLKSAIRREDARRSDHCGPTLRQKAILTCKSPEKSLLMKSVRVGILGRQHQMTYLLIVEESSKP
jgi:SpoVK/Ycf46/Vps4 family AAA+-type ATPase